MQPSSYYKHLMKGPRQETSDEVIDLLCLDRAVPSQLNKHVREQSRARAQRDNLFGIPFPTTSILPREPFIDPEFEEKQQ